MLPVIISITRSEHKTHRYNYTCTYSFSELNFKLLACR